MFGKLFGRRSIAPNPTPGPQMGMLMLHSTQGLTPERIVSAWAELFPDIPALNAGEMTVKDGIGVGEFSTDGRALRLATMNMPIPQPEIDHAASVSWMWPEGAEAVRAQRAHAIAMTAGKDVSAVQAAFDVSRLVAAAAKAGESVGVYWGNGMLVHKPELFIDAVSSFDAEGPPVMLWVNVLISGRSANGPFTLSTHGMPNFGHKELEVIGASTFSLGDLRMWAYNTIVYLLVNGPIYLDGQTAGPTPEDKWKIEHTISKFRKGEPVIRIHVP